jgi:hypothetical protein
MPPRNATDFLELAENCTFLDRKLIRALNETVDKNSESAHPETVDFGFVKAAANLKPQAQPGHARA